MPAPDQPAPMPWFLQFFIHPTEKRPRLFWRLLGQFFLMAVLQILLAAGVGIGLNNITPPPLTQALIGQALSFLAVLLSVYIAAGYLDQRSLTSLGVAWDRQSVIQIITGIGFGILLVTVMLLSLWVSGSLALDLNTLDAALGLQLSAGLFAALLAAGQDELLRRGYWFSNLRGSFGNLRALIMIALLNAGLNLLLPNATPLTAALAAQAALMYGLAVLVTGRLWLGIGLHTAWNFSLGLLLGLPVAGDVLSGLFTPTVSGPAWWTGGLLGPEGGLAWLPGLLICTALLWFYRNRLTPQPPSA